MRRVAVGSVEVLSDGVRVVLPIRTSNPLNAARGSSRFALARTRRHHRGLAASVVRAALRGRVVLPCIVRLTRSAPSSGLDPHDGLPAALKAIVDGVADALGIDDRDPRVRWEYAQERGPYAVRVEVRP